MKLIRQATIYTYKCAHLTQETLEKALSGKVFAPCLPTEERSAGFERFSDIFGNSMTIASGTTFMGQYHVQTKSVPSSVINKELKSRIDAIAQNEQRKVKGKERQEIKDNIKHALLVRAFPKDGCIRFFFDTEKNYLIFETTSEKGIEEIVSLLLKNITDLTMEPWSVPNISAAQQLKTLFVEEHENNAQESIFGDEMKLSGGTDGSLIHYKKMNLWHPSIYTTIEEHPFVEVSLHNNDVSFHFLPHSFQFKGINAQDIMNNQKDTLKEIEDPLILTQAVMLLQQSLVHDLVDYIDTLLR